MATVLLVDDEKILRTLVAVALRRQGLEVIEASSGEQALTLARRLAHPIDLLVSGLALPRRDGLEVARRLTGRCPAARVLLLSRCPHPAELERRAREAGIEVLREPFGLPELLGVAGRQLGRTFEVRKPPASSRGRRRPAAVKAGS